MSVEVNTWSPDNIAGAPPPRSSSPYIAVGCGLLGISRPGFVYWDHFARGPGITDATEMNPFGSPWQSSNAGSIKLDFNHILLVSGCTSGSVDFGDANITMGKPRSGGTGRFGNGFGVTGWYCASRLYFDANSVPAVGNTFVRLNMAVLTSNTQATMGIVGENSLTNYVLALYDQGTLFSNTADSSWHVFEMWHLPSVNTHRVYGRIDGGTPIQVNISSGFSFGTGLCVQLRGCNFSKPSSVYFDWVLFVTDGN